MANLSFDIIYSGKLVQFALRKKLLLKLIVIYYSFLSTISFMQPVLKLSNIFEFILELQPFFQQKVCKKYL